MCVCGTDEGLRWCAVALGQSVQVQVCPGLLGGRLHRVLLLVNCAQRAGLQHQVAGLVLALLFLIVLLLV